VRPTIVIHLDGLDWRVSGLTSLRHTPLDEHDERRGVVRYCPESERDEAREWVRRLTAESRVLTCVYCGHAYPPGSPEHGAEVLTEHIKVCEKHPMRELQQKADRLDQLEGALLFLNALNFDGHGWNPDRIVELAHRQGWAPPKEKT
jgi:hypothetical protein